MSNMNGIDVQAIFKEVRANRDKLKACRLHRFEPTEEERRTLGVKLTCVNCGGTLSRIEAAAYVEGYEAAGKDPNEVWENYRVDVPSQAS
jgi:hypothetical protein